MTHLQHEFYKLLRSQMVDFNEEFHEEFTKERLEKIEDDRLKYLLDDIYKDKDNLTKKKGFLTYAKFIYYADKLIEKNLTKKLQPTIPKVDELYNKREQLLKSIELASKGSLSKKNQLIEDLQNRKLMFKSDGKNILDSLDYYIIDKFGFYNFLDENRTYHLKEDIERYLKEYFIEKEKQQSQILQLN